MKNRSAISSLALMTMIALLVVGFVISGISAYIVKSVSDVPRQVRDEVQAVVRAETYSAITGKGFWEDKLLVQTKFVKGLSNQDRLVYYREVLIRFDVNNDRVGYFSEDFLGADAPDLHAHLLAYRKSPAYQDLPASQRQRLDGWIAQLPVIIQQGKHVPQDEVAYARH